MARGQASGSATCETPNECSADVCVGTAVEACVNGRKVRVDCKALGFTGCTSGNGTASCQ